MTNKIINYLVLIGTIIIAFICDSDLVKVSSILFFFGFVSLQDLFIFLNRKRIEDDFKKDVEKQIEALKSSISDINFQLLKNKMR